MTGKLTYEEMEERISILENELIKSRQANEERRKLDQQIFQTHKMDEIGQLARGLAHALNNILAGIQGNTFLLQMDYDHEDPHYQRLSHIEEQVNRGANLMKQLLRFTTDGKYEFKTIAINDLIRENVQFFTESRNKIEADFILPDHIYPVEAVSEQIVYALLNIYTNLGHAMPRGGCIHIQTTNMIFEDIDITEIKPGFYVKISITVSGTEIDEKMLRVIFEPFLATMQKQGELGLAFVNGIIRDHGGAIKAYIEPNTGCKIDIYLPASVKEAMQEEEQPSDQKLLLFGNGGILLIDDEPLILDSASEMLKMLGYSVYQAADGNEAVEIYTKFKDSIDLVILDMILPVMNGSEVLTILQEINPYVKVILSSGFSIDDEIMRVMKMGCLAFIQKPYEFTNLSKVVRQVIFPESTA